MSQEKPMNFRYPITNDKEGEYSAEELFQLTNAENQGQYLLSQHDYWHGGVHFSNEQHNHYLPIRAMADGKVIAYRINQSNLESEYEEEGRDKKTLKYSNGFCLIKHEYEVKEEKTAEEIAAEKNKKAIQALEDEWKDKTVTINQGGYRYFASEEKAIDGKKSTGSIETDSKYVVKGISEKTARKHRFVKAVLLDDGKESGDAVWFAVFNESGEVAESSQKPIIQVDKSENDQKKDSAAADSKNESKEKDEKDEKDEKKEKEKSNKLTFYTLYMHLLAHDQYEEGMPHPAYWGAENREEAEDQDVDKESAPTGLSEIEDYKKFGLNSALSSAPETMGSEPLPALTKAPYPVMNSVGKVVGHLTKNSRITLEGIGDLGDYTTINALFKMEQAAILNNRGEHVPFDEGMTLNIDENDLSLLGLSRETVSDVNNHLQNLSFLKNLDLSQTVETATTETEETKKEEPPAEPTTFDEVVPLTEGFEIKAGDVVGFMGVYDTLVEKADEENRQSIENRKVIDVNYISRKEYTNPYKPSEKPKSSTGATPVESKEIAHKRYDVSSTKYTETRKDKYFDHVANEFYKKLDDEIEITLDQFKSDLQTLSNIKNRGKVKANQIYEIPVYTLKTEEKETKDSKGDASDSDSVITNDDSLKSSTNTEKPNEADSTLPKGKDHKRQAHLELFTVMEKSELEKFLENDAKLLQDRKYVEVSGREHFYPEPITLDNPFMIPGTKKDDVLESKTKDIKENGVNNAIKAMLDLEEKAIRKELVDQIPILYEALKRAKDAGVEEYQSVPDTLKEYIDKYTDQHVKKFMKKRRKSYDEYRHRDVSQKENKIYYDTLQEELEKSQTSMEEAINKHYTDYGKVKRFAEDGEIVEILSVDPIKEGDTEYYSVKHDNKKGHIKKSSVKGEMFCQHDWDKLGFQIVEGEDDSHGYLEDDPIIKIFQAIYQAHPAHKKQGSSANSVTEIKDILEKGKKTNNQPVGDEKPSDFYWQKLVAKHPTEWQGLENSAYLEKFKAVLTEDHDDNLLKEQSDAVIAHEEERIEKLGFWNEVDELSGNKAPYHFHPIAFLENVVDIGDNPICMVCKKSLILKLEFLQKIGPNASNNFIQELENASRNIFTKYKINTCSQIIHLLGQGKQETNQFTSFREGLYYKSYTAEQILDSISPTKVKNGFTRHGKEDFSREERLKYIEDNLIANDKNYGWHLYGYSKYPNGDFRGRGLIQVTDLNHYKLLAKDTGLDVLNNPQLMENDNSVIIESALWYWNWKKPSLATVADNTKITLEDASKKIGQIVNGVSPAHGEKDRIRFTKEIKEVFEQIYGKCDGIQK